MGTCATPHPARTPCSVLLCIPIRLYPAVTYIVLEIDDQLLTSYKKKSIIHFQNIRVSLSQPYFKLQMIIPFVLAFHCIALHCNNENVALGIDCCYLL